MSIKTRDVELECRNPDCSSKSILEVIEAKMYSPVDGLTFEANFTMYECKTCGFDWADDKKNNEQFKKAQNDANKKFVNNIISKIVENYNTNYVSIERSLSLPPRTISRWIQYGKVSSSGLTLLKAAECIPGFLKVAANNFSESSIKDEIFEPISHQIYDDLLSGAKNHLGSSSKHEKVSIQVITASQGEGDIAVNTDVQDTGNAEHGKVLSMVPQYLTGT